jgi:hypothetical protein
MRDGHPEPGPGPTVPRQQASSDGISAPIFAGSDLSRVSAQEMGRSTSIEHAPNHVPEEHGIQPLVLEHQHQIHDIPAASRASPLYVRAKACSTPLYRRVRTVRMLSSSAVAGRGSLQTRSTASSEQDPTVCVWTAYCVVERRFLGELIAPENRPSRGYGNGHSSTPRPDVLAD